MCEFGFFSQNENENLDRNTGCTNKATNLQNSGVIQNHAKTSVLWLHARARERAMRSDENESEMDNRPIAIVTMTAFLATHRLEM